MQIFLWILAFIGILLIYPVPLIASKLGASDKVNIGLKVAGICFAAISLIALNALGAFKQ